MLHISQQGLYMWRHININKNNNNNNNNDDDNNIHIYIYIYIYNIEKLKERKERGKKIIEIYLRHKAIQWKTQDCLIQRKYFQS